MVPLSVLFYCLPYWIRGRGDALFYELGALAERFITLAVGIVALLLFVGLCIAMNRRRVWVLYAVVAGIMAVAYAVSGFTDTIPDFGEARPRSD